MPIVSAIVVFSLCWWALFFIALPIGVRIPDEQGEGHAASAPEHPGLKPKIIWVTLIATLFTALWVWVSANRLIDWHGLLQLGS